MERGKGGAARQVRTLTASVMMNNQGRDPQKIKIVIIEDHPLFLAGLEKALSLEADMWVLGTASEGNAGIELVINTHPDVILLDVNLPDLNGLQVARKLRSTLPSLGVIMITAYHDPEQVLYAMRAGASAYCSKQIHPAELMPIIRQVAAGYYIIGDKRLEYEQLQEWIRITIEELIGPYVNEPEQHFVPLSPRETEILHSVIHGMSNKEIAGTLGISQQTVKNHMTSILQKLNVRDRTQAAVTAIRHGWVRLQDDYTPNNLSIVDDEE